MNIKQLRALMALAMPVLVLVSSASAQFTGPKPGFIFQDMHSKLPNNPVGSYTADVNDNGILLLNWDYGSSGQGCYVTDGNTFAALKDAFYASAINNKGNIVGHAKDPKRGIYTTAVWDGPYTDWTPIPYYATVIDSQGIVFGGVGKVFITNPNPFVGTSQLSTAPYTSGVGMDINDYGVCVGSVGTWPWIPAYWDKQGKLHTILIPQGYSGSITAVNNGGTMLVNLWDPYGMKPSVVALVDKYLRWTMLQIPNATVYGSSLNNYNAVVGTIYYTNPNKEVPFVYTPRHGLILLPLPEDALGGKATSVNNRGQIGGDWRKYNGQENGQGRAARWTPRPPYH